MCGLSVRRWVCATVSRERMSECESDRERWAFRAANSESRKQKVSEVSERTRGGRLVTAKRLMNTRTTL
jgi:hypothetical protein